MEINEEILHEFPRKYGLGAEFIACKGEMMKEVARCHLRYLTHIEKCQDQKASRILKI